MNTTQIFDGILNIVFFFLGDKIKGYRGIILNVLAVAIGTLGWVTADGGLFDFLCSLGPSIAVFAAFCDPENFKWYPIIFTVISILNMMNRYVASLPVGLDPAKAPQSLRIGGYKAPTWVSALIYMSIGFLFIIAIFTGDFLPLLMIILSLSVLLGFLALVGWLVR